LGSGKAKKLCEKYRVKIHEILSNTSFMMFNCSIIAQIIYRISWYQFARKCSECL